MNDEDAGFEPNNIVPGLGFRGLGFRNAGFESNEQHCGWASATESERA